MLDYPAIQLDKNLMQVGYCYLKPMEKLILLHTELFVICLKAKTKLDSILITIKKSMTVKQVR